MKQFFVQLFLIVVTISSFGQTKGQYDERSDSLLIMNRQNHNYQDTLWVMDSVLTYQVYGIYGLLLKNTYKVISRNNLGNKLTSLEEYNGDFPGSYQNHIFDSIIYFNNVDIKQSYSKIWIPALNMWKLEKFKSYEKPKLYVENMEKIFSASSQQFYGGYRYLHENVEGKVYIVFSDLYVKETDSWQSVSKTTHFYDDSGNDTLQLSCRWKNNMWVDSIKHRNYFEAGVITRQYDYILNGVDSSWQNYSARFQEYSSSGLNTEVFVQKWDNVNAEWVDFYKFIMSYDNEGRIVNSLYLEYNPDSQQLENSRNSIMDYEEGKTVYTYQGWDATLCVWHNNSQYVYSYIKDDLIDTVQGNNWNDVTQQWQGYYRDISRYDEHFNVIDMTRYNFVVNDWLIAWKYDFYWSPFIPNATHEIQANTLAVYPNPATTRVSFVVPDNQANTGQQALLTIFDLSGRQMTQLPLQNGKAVWDCAGVKAGLYVYSLSGSGAWVSGKVVVR